MRVLLAFLPELAEQGHVAAAPVAKHKIRPDTDAVNPAEVTNHFPHKLLARFFAEGAVKGDFQHGIHAERLGGPQFLRGGINSRRQFVGRDNRMGMPVKRHDQGQGIVLARVGDGLPDDLLVPEVQTVEHPDRQANLLVAVAQFFGGAAEFHVRPRRASNTG